MQKETFRTWDASPMAATAPEEVGLLRSFGYWGFTVSWYRYHDVSRLSFSNLYWLPTPKQNPAVGYWCTGLEAALEVLNSLSYPPWSRTQSLALHARIMPALLRKLDVFLVESLVVTEGELLVCLGDRECGGRSSCVYSWHAQYAGHSITSWYASV